MSFSALRRGSLTNSGSDSAWEEGARAFHAVQCTQPRCRRRPVATVATQRAAAHGGGRLEALGNSNHSVVERKPRHSEARNSAHVIWRVLFSLFWYEQHPAGHFVKNLQASENLSDFISDNLSSHFALTKQKRNNFLGFFSAQKGFRLWS